MLINRLTKYNSPTIIVCRFNSLEIFVFFIRKDKEMKNFISLLDTTLRMNKDEDKSESDDDDDDDIITPDQLAPPGGTTYIKRAPGKSKPPAGGSDAENTPQVNMPEPENEASNVRPNPLNPKMDLQEYLNMSYSPSGAAGETSNQVLVTKH